jgi:thymidylate synthase
MAKIDKDYHDLLSKIKNDGFKYEDPNRKGIFRYQIPSYQMVHNFADGFPAITTKKLYWKAVVGELLWFLRGDTNIKYLNDNNIHIWDKDANNYSKNGSIGKGYGAQWRNWTGNILNFGYGDTPHSISHVDQISNLIKGLRETPMGTKHIVTAWNPAELDDMALPPCHWSFEILVEPIKLSKRCLLSSATNLISEKVTHLYLDKINIPKYQFTLKWHQRSVDTFLGLPFNIASYATLAQIIGKLTNMVPKGIIGDLSNVHIYEPHMDAVNKQLNNNVNKYGKCELDNPMRVIKNLENSNIDDFLKVTDIGKFNLKGYESYPAIPAEMLAYS